MIQAQQHLKKFGIFTTRYKLPCPLATEHSKIFSETFIRKADLTCRGNYYFSNEMHLCKLCKLEVVSVRPGIYDP